MPLISREFLLTVLFSALVLAACGSSAAPPPIASAAELPPASVPAAAASSAAPAPPLRAMLLPSSNTDAAGCPDREPLDLAAEDLREAGALIKRAGEHPSDRDLAEILPRLKRAAYAGLEEAQWQFGFYVVGYYYTDLMFWPKHPDIAIPALAMLRIAARRSPKKNDALAAALARDPVKFTDRDGPPALPRAWINAALKEARRWEACAARADGR